MVGLQRPANQYPAGPAGLPRFVVTGSPSPPHSPPPPPSATTLTIPRMAGVSKPEPSARTPPGYVDFEPPRSARPIRSARRPLGAAPAILPGFRLPASITRPPATVARAPPLSSNRQLPIYIDFEPPRSARLLRSARPRSGRVVRTTAPALDLPPYGGRPSSPLPPPDPIRPSSRPPPRTERSSLLRVPDGKSAPVNQLLPSLAQGAPRWNPSTSISSSINATFRTAPDLRRLKSASRLAAFDRSSSETDVYPASARMNLTSRGRSGRLRSSGHLDETSFTIVEMCRTNSLDQKNNDSDDYRLAGPSSVETAPETVRSEMATTTTTAAAAAARCSPSLLRARLALLGPSMEIFDEPDVADCRDFGIRDFLNAGFDSLDAEDESSLAGDINIGLGLQPPRFSVDSFDAQLSSLLELRENDDALLPLWSATTTARTADRTAVRAVIRRSSEDVGAMQRARRTSVIGGGEANEDALNHGTNGDPSSPVRPPGARRMLRKSFSLPHAMVVPNTAALGGKVTQVHRTYGSANIAGRLDALTLQPEMDGMKPDMTGLEPSLLKKGNREPLRRSREENTIDELEDDADWVMEDEDEIEPEITSAQGNGRL